MPFITEELWSYLPDRTTMLIQAEWPVYDEAKKYDAEVARVELAMAIIRSIRNIRVEADAAPSKKLRAVILAKNAADVQAEEKHICKMAGISEITFAASKSEVPEEVMSAVVDGAEIYIPLDDLLDYKAEFERLQKEEARLQGEVKRIGGMLSNQAFVSKAPEKVVNTEREKLAKAEEMLGKVKERLEMVAKKL